MRIIVDSGCDLSSEMKEEIQNDALFDLVPLSLMIDEAQFIDDGKLDIERYMAAMEASKHSVKTAAPSPQLFLDRFKKDGAAFVVTISSKLSASYNNALLAKELYMDEAKDKFIHVFDSLSATCGQTLIAMKIREAVAGGMKEHEVVQRVEGFVESMKTFFILEKYDNLVKGGRMNPLLAKAAGILGVRPICHAVNGEIDVVDKQRGTRRAFERLSEIIAETVVKEKIDAASRTLAISHAKAMDKATMLKEAVLAKTRFKDTLIMEMGGLGTTYADKGGVIVAF